MEKTMVKSKDRAGARPEKKTLPTKTQLAGDGSALPTERYAPLPLRKKPSGAA